MPDHQGSRHPKKKAEQGLMKLLGRDATDTKKELAEAHEKLEAHKEKEKDQEKNKDIEAVEANA